MAVNPRILGVKALRSRKNVTAWQQPVMSPKWYTMFCCDCALAHQHQYRIVKGHVQFRVRRANLYTQLLRKRKSERKYISTLKRGDCVRALLDDVMVITLTNGLKRGGTKRERDRERKRKRKRRG